MSKHADPARQSAVEGAPGSLRSQGSAYAVKGRERGSAWQLLGMLMLLLPVTVACAPIPATVTIPSANDNSPPSLSLFASQGDARGVSFGEEHKTEPQHIGRLPADRPLTFTAIAHNGQAGIRYVRIDATFTTKCRVRDANGMEVERGATVQETVGREEFTAPVPGQAVPTTRTVVGAFAANAVDAICSGSGGSQGRVVNGQATVSASTYFGVNHSATYLFSFSPPRLD
jgi:hypothetical protein